jgi:cobalt-zinc-cadmium resistance protein CzcA
LGPPTGSGTFAAGSGQYSRGIGKPELGPISTGLGEIFQYVVRAKKGYENVYDETELRTIQDWVVRRQLLGTKGVADVSSFGGKLKQYEIAINPNKLQAFNININDVFSALESNNQNTGGAYIEKKKRFFLSGVKGFWEPKKISEYSGS